MDWKPVTTPPALGNELADPDSGYLEATYSITEGVEVKGTRFFRLKVTYESP